MTSQLFPDLRRLTDQELQERIDGLREDERGAALWEIGVCDGLLREFRRRAGMTSHERIALARSLAEERAQ